LPDKGLHHFRQFHVEGHAREIGPVAPILSGAKKEHLDADLATFGMGGEQIGFVEGSGIDPLAGLDLAHRLQPVAQPRRRLEIQRL